MKKVYMQPVATAYDVVAEQMIAESVKINKGTSADPNYSGGGDAKEFDFDDEESEDLW